MKKFFIVENTSKPKSGEIADRLCACIEKCGGSYARKDGFFELPDVPKDAECIITIGGDGTVIRTASSVRERDIPIVGIKSGHMGYLTSASSEEETDKLIQNLIQNKFKVSKRIMLDGYVDGEYVGTALNDIIVGRKTFMHIARMKISIDGVVLNEYACDGIIIATPTGSTAYNLSAGGPIAQPESDLMILTPICAHGTATSSLIFSGESEIRIEICESQMSVPAVSFDGIKQFTLDIGSVITIKKSKHTTTLIQPEGDNFINNLRNKLEII